MNIRDCLRALADVCDEFLNGIAGEEELRSMVSTASGVLDQPQDEEGVALYEVMAMHPDLSEQEAANFLAQVRGSGLSWRMGDVIPILSEDDQGNRLVRSYERHRVVVDAFDQWTRALDARWSADKDYIVTSADLRHEYRCEKDDTLVCLELRDTVLRAQYVRDFERYVDACGKLGIASIDAYNAWLKKAGEPPQDTITNGYGVWRGTYEIVDTRYGKSPVWMARKRAERDAIQRRAPHIISMRHQIPVDKQVAEIMIAKEELTPEQIADRYVENARKLGRRSLIETDLI